VKTKYNQGKASNLTSGCGENGQERPFWFVLAPNALGSAWFGSSISCCRNCCWPGLVVCSLLMLHEGVVAMLDLGFPVCSQASFYKNAYKKEEEGGRLQKKNKSMKPLIMLVLS
jgi:hypothetical protein